jgi:hypothetical protein
MRISRFLVGALAALMLLPASALGQDLAGDHYLAPIFIANEQTPLPLTPSVLGYEIADTTPYTNDSGLGVFPQNVEYNRCTLGSRSSDYDKTVWSVFYTDRYGRLDVTATGFDAVIGLARFNNPNDPAPTAQVCSDRLAGRIESFPRDNLPTVRKGGWYALQVGGYIDPATGAVASGPLQVNVELLTPEQIIADAGITWTASSGGVKIKQIRVEGPQGSNARISCRGKSCGSQSVNNPKPVGVFEEPALKAKADATSTNAKPKAGKKPEVTVLTKNVFKNKKVKNGARLLVLVRADNQIGQAFYWDIKGNAAGAKQIGCLEPGSSTPRRLGTCDGK